MKHKWIFLSFELFRLNAVTAGLPFCQSLWEGVLFEHQLYWQHANIEQKWKKFTAEKLDENRLWEHENKGGKRGRPWQFKLMFLIQKVLKKKFFIKIKQKLASFQKSHSRKIFCALIKGPSRRLTSFPPSSMTKNMFVPSPTVKVKRSFRELLPSWW